MSPWTKETICMVALRYSAELSPSMETPTT